MKNGTKPRANPFVVLREEFDDWAILFDPDTGRGLGLSPIGVYLWRLLDGEHTRDALLQKIRHDADNVPEEASDHIGPFVDDLVARGLVGFGGTAFGPKKRPSLPRVTLSGAKRFPYEPPKLIDFLADRPAVGKCHFGSEDNGTCGTGHLAGVTCVPTGNAAVGDCNTGVSKGGACSGGGTPQFTCTGGGIPH